MEVKTTTLSAYDNLELKEATFQNQSFPDHFHDAYSIGILERGIEQIILPHKTIIAHANAVIVINPYDIHAHCCFDNESWKYRIIYINADAVNYIQNKAGLSAGKRLYFPTQLIEDNHLYQLILNFHLHSSENKMQYLDIIIRYLVAAYSEESPESTVTQYKGRIKEAASFMQHNFSDKIIVDDIAAQFGMDKYKFIRSFKQEIGITPVSYLLLHRINHSKKLISQKMPIVEVALETGFYDQSHFTHYFKKYIGISPLLYRKGLVTG